MRFHVTTEAKDPLDLRGLCEKFCNELWVPEHVDPEEKARFALDCFRRTVQEGLRMLEVSIDNP